LDARPELGVVQTSHGIVEVQFSFFNSLLVGILTFFIFSEALFALLVEV
jgi:hypothetical protein